MERIKDTLESVIRELSAQKKIPDSQGPEAWLRKALTKKERGHIKFHYFRKGILGLSVDSSVWLYSLNLKKAGLLNKLKECSAEVKEIRFNIGDIN